MAKELVYRVRIEYDSDQAAEGAATIDNTQERAEQSVNNTTAAIRRQQEAQEQASRSTRNFSKVQSNANQTLFSFGDLLNDSQQFQFGFAQGTRAIGNNIGFAAEQFSQISSRAGGFQNALKALGSSLLGPGGIILGINAAVTAITVFGDRLFGTKEKAKDFNIELKKSNEFLTDLTEQKISNFVDAFENTDRQLESVNDAIDNLVGKLPEGVDLMSQLEEITKSNKEEFRQTGRILDDRIGLLQEEDRSLGEIEQRALKILKNKRAELRAQQEINKALQGTLVSTSQQFNITNAQLDSLSNFVRRLTELGTQQIGFRGLEDAGPLGLSPEELERREERKKQIRIQKEREAFARIGMTREQGLKQFEQYLVQEQKAKEDTEEAKTRIEKLEQKQRQESMLTAVQASADAIGVIFENSKAASIASAVINAGAAIVRQFKDLPLYAAIPSAALVAAKTAKQIEKIQNVEPGNAGSVSSAGGGGSQSGIRSTEINRRNQAATQGVRSPQGQPIQNNITIQTEADDRIISVKAENGRKQRQQNAVTIGN